MSHSTNAKINNDPNYQIHPKVQTKQYLYNSGEPEDNSDSNSSAGYRFEMLDNSNSMKQRIRRHAQRMRRINY